MTNSRIRYKNLSVCNKDEKKYIALLNVISRPTQDHSSPSHPPTRAQL